MFLFCYNKKRRPTVSLKQAVESATQVVVSDNLSVNDKLLGLFAAMQIGKLTGGEVMLDYLHRPQNSLFHEKSQQMIFKKISPLLAQIIREGNLQNVFNNDFPEETAEMAVLIISGFIDSNLREALPQRIEALLYNLEKMLGAKRRGEKLYKDLTPLSCHFLLFDRIRVYSRCIVSAKCRRKSGENV